MKPWPQQVLELAYWTPLVVLVLVSLGIVALKRIQSPPLWAQRLRGVPFYLIAIPVVTLGVGIEILLLVIDSLRAWFALVDSSLWFHALVLLLFGIPMTRPNETLIVLLSGCVVCVALVLSLSTLRREFSNEDREGSVMSKPRQRLKGLVLAFALVWTWLSLRYIIVEFESTRFMNLRIVLAASRDATIDQPRSLGIKNGRYC